MKIANISVLEFQFKVHLLAGTVCIYLVVMFRNASNFLFWFFFSFWCSIVKACVRLMLFALFNSYHYSYFWLQFFEAFKAFKKKHIHNRLISFSAKHILITAFFKFANLHWNFYLDWHIHFKLCSNWIEFILCE